MKKINKNSLSSIEETKEGFKFNFGKPFLQVIIGIVLLLLGIVHWIFAIIFIIYIFVIVFYNIINKISFLKKIASKGKGINEITFENKKPFREVEVKIK